MLMRFDPFHELERLTQQVWGPAARVATMPMDAYRDGDRFIVHFDLPGVDPGSIDVSVEKNVLTVAAERTWTRGDGTDVVASERFQGRYSRQLFLGEGLDADSVQASYDNGVLTITIPVAAQAQARKVEISSGGSGPKVISGGGSGAGAATAGEGEGAAPPSNGGGADVGVQGGTRTHAGGGGTLPPGGGGA